MNVEIEQKTDSGVFPHSQGILYCVWCRNDVDPERRLMFACVREDIAQREVQKLRAEATQIQAIYNRVGHPLKKPWEFWYTMQELAVT